MNSPTACRQALLVALLVLLSGCGPDRDAVDLPDRDPTTETASPGPPQVVKISDERIPESSGLARSSVHLGVLYTHNDRGNPPEVFAVSAAGTRAVLRLFDAPRGDWEDIATTPDRRIWVGDIGDNGGTRESVAVYVVPEPDPLKTRDVPWTRYELRYEDGPRDAEALMVHPETHRVYVVSKDPNGGAIYAAPKELSASQPNSLTRVASAPANITAADFSPDGNSFALRNYRAVYLYDDIGSRPLPETLPRQEQGESLTFASDGGGLLIGTEGRDSLVLEIPLPTRAATRGE